MYIDDMLTYYHIKLDADGKKRVQELHDIRSDAESNDDWMKVAEVDQELNLIYQGV